MEENHYLPLTGGIALTTVLHCESVIGVDQDSRWSGAAKLECVQGRQNAKAGAEN